MLRLRLLPALFLIGCCIAGLARAPAAETPARTAPPTPDSLPGTKAAEPPGPPPPAASTDAPTEPTDEELASAGPQPFDPPILLGTPPGYGAPVTATGLRLVLPATTGWRVGPATVHPYGGLRFESRSNVFYKTSRVDPDTLEALDMGLHLTTAAQPAQAGAASALQRGIAGRLIADYNARFELFNRFSELNYIQQHALVAAELRTPDFGADLVDTLGTAHDPDTVELATLVNREVRRFYHHLELSAFDPCGDDPTAGRFGIAATVDNARYEGTALNAAETDAYGVNLTWSQPQTVLPWASDPVIFKFSVKGFDHPQPVLNNFVMYQAVIKLGGVFGDPGPNGDWSSTGEARANGPKPWDFELAFGLALIDVQTFHALAPQQRQDAFAPVIALQIDGDLNSRQYLHFRFNALHEPDVSLLSNFQRRTRLAASLSQHLGESYEWEFAAAEEWSDPSRGPTLAQFTFHGELRWYKEYASRYFGRHAPVFFRVESRNVTTAERNRTGVHTWNDTRVTLGWAIAL